MIFLLSKPNENCLFLIFTFSQVFCEILTYMKEHPRDCVEENEVAYTVTRISASDCTSAAVWPKGIIYNVLINLSCSRVASTSPTIDISR